MARVPRGRRILPAMLAIALAAAAATARPAPAAPPAGLGAGLAPALAAPGGSPWRTGAAAADPETGQPLFALPASLPLLPASNEKLPVTFAALRELGAGFTFDTLVLGDGEQDDAGTWTGD